MACESRSGIVTIYYISYKVCEHEIEIHRRPGLWRRNCTSYKFRGSEPRAGYRTPDRWRSSWDSQRYGVQTRALLVCRQLAGVAIEDRVATMGAGRREDDL